MKPTLPVPRTAACAAALLLLAVAAQDARARSGADVCEEAVGTTIVEVRGASVAKEIEFIAARRVVSVQSAQQTSIRGEGRYRGAAGRARSFTYQCAYDADAGTASGVVFKETGAAPPSSASPASPQRERAWEPDLSRLSPEACETAAAAALKRRYPSVGSISFATDTRQLRPAPEGRTSLEGQGRMARAPGLNPVRFNYRCELEARSGRLVSVETGE